MALHLTTFSSVLSLPSTRHSTLLSNITKWATKPKQTTSKLPVPAEFNRCDHAEDIPENDCTKPTQLPVLRWRRIPASVWSPQLCLHDLHRAAEPRDGDLQLWPHRNPTDLHTRVTGHNYCQTKPLQKNLQLHVSKLALPPGSLLGQGEQNNGTRSLEYVNDEQYIFQCSHYVKHPF